MIIDPMKAARRAKARKQRQRRNKRERRRASGELRCKSACFVYALKDQAGAVRYVGQTRSALSERMAFHVKSASPSGSPIQRWLSENVATIHLLEKDGIWDVSEVIWIERMRVAGEPLLNANLGGRDSRSRVA